MNLSPRERTINHRRPEKKLSRASRRKNLSRNSLKSDNSARQSAERATYQPFLYFYRLNGQCTITQTPSAARDAHSRSVLASALAIHLEELGKRHSTRPLRCSCKDARAKEEEKSCCAKHTRAAGALNVCGWAWQVTSSAQKRFFRIESGLQSRERAPTTHSSVNKRREE